LQKSAAGEMSHLGLAYQGDDQGEKGSDRFVHLMADTSSDSVFRSLQKVHWLGQWGE